MKHTIFAVIFCMIFAQTPLFAVGMSGEPLNDGGRREMPEPKEKNPPEKETEPKKEEKKEKESVNYHGKKLPIEHELFAVVVIVVGKTNMSIIFNMPVNPRSFSKADVYINGAPLPQNASMKFNRSGKILEITMPIPNEIDLRLYSISSFDGEVLKKSDFLGLRKNSSNKY